jgi:hypothetical protein
MTKITTKRITRYTLTTDDEREFELPFGEDWMPDEALVTDLPDGRTVISYLCPDNDGTSESPLERDDDAVEWIEFRNGYERNEWIDANLHGCEHCGDTAEDHDDEHCGYEGGWTPTDYRKAFDAGHLFAVERYEHGLVRYGLSNESSQVDRMWDVAPCVAFLRLDDEWGPTVDLKEMARSILNEYTDWCNGNVFGVVHCFYGANGEPDGDEEACWGYIGDEHAEQTMTEEHAWHVERESKKIPDAGFQLTLEDA